MPRGIIYLETMPVSPEREDDYHEWYNDVHLAEIVSVDGMVSAPLCTDRREGAVHRDLRA